ncbi:MAG: hypothetical protein ACRDNL_03045 [Spirillospora sp.]
MPEPSASWNGVRPATALGRATWTSATPSLSTSAPARSRSGCRSGCRLRERASTPWRRPVTSPESNWPHPEGIEFRTPPTSTAWPIRLTYPDRHLDRGGSTQ